MTVPSSSVLAPRLLLIDDSPDDQHLAARALRQAFPDVTLRTAQSAPELAAALEEGGFEAVITDYHLGFTNGLEVLRQVKARFAECPVILFTLTGDEEIAVAVMKAGAEDYVLKTSRSLPQLVGAVGRAVARARERVRLQDAENRYRDLFDRVPVGLFRVHADGTLLDVNPALARLLGFATPAEVLGQNVSAFLPRSGEASALSSALLAGQDVNAAHLILRRADGQTVWVELSVRAVLAPDSGVLGAEGSAQDVTDRVQAERDLQFLNAELEQRVERRTAELAELNGELEAFSYSVSHDLRAPLRHIDGFANLLRKEAREKLSERGAAHLDRILEASARMSALIDGLLAFARAGREQLRFVPVDLGALIDAVRSDLGPEQGERQIEWRVGALPTVQGDPTALRQAFTNLLSNALKYTRPRPVAVIEVWAEDGEETVTLRVRDNGVGFDERQKERLFGVFQRLHGPQEFEGTGVGLASVRRIVERHGGTVNAQSGPGEGATFVLTLPRDGLRPA